MLPSIFDDVFGDVSFKKEDSLMRTDIRLAGDNYILDIDLPGYDKKDIKLELERGYLTITAEKNDENIQKEEKKYIRKERYYGKCSRTFYVGDTLSEEDIKANYKNGILSVTVPKESKVENKKVIEISD